MTVEMRRVVTGHDADGKSIVVSDSMRSNARSSRVGAELMGLWHIETFPGDNADDADGANLSVSAAVAGGIIFRILRYEPGVAPYMHRSDTVDFAVVLDGEITLELDREEVVLRKGDALVQRGTMHNWINRSDTPCTIAVVLTAAAPLALPGGSAA